MMAEDPITTEVSAERESESFSEALPLYLQEIGRVPLLTGAAEVELAMAAESLTGLLSWLEAAPPGMRYRLSPASPD